MYLLLHSGRLWQGSKFDYLANLGQNANIKTRQYINFVVFWWCHGNKFVLRCKYRACGRWLHHPPATVWPVNSVANYVFLTDLPNNNVCQIYLQIQLHFLCLVNLVISGFITKMNVVYSSFLVCMYMLYHGHEWCIRFVWPSPRAVRPEGVVI